MHVALRQARLLGIRSSAHPGPSAQCQITHFNISTQDVERDCAFSHFDACYLESSIKCNHNLMLSVC